VKTEVEVKTEMDAMGMDERQRNAWLQANRLTLMLVGVTWLGMIAWELAHQRMPLFLILMVPVFAALRFGLYLVYARSG
jgi:hypothetical protein